MNWWPELRAASCFIPGRLSKRENERSRAVVVSEIMAEARRVRGKARTPPVQNKVEVSARDAKRAGLDLRF